MTDSLGHLPVVDCQCVPHVAYYCTNYPYAYVWTIMPMSVHAWFLLIQS